MEKLSRDDRMDLAIRILDELVALGFVPDCTDTEDESEFKVMDIIEDILKKANLYKN